jgi:hypothetical protein
MDNAAFDALPRAYRLGLRLRALGADDELIAECLEVDPASVSTLLDIGARKAENLKLVIRHIDQDHDATTSGVDPGKALE